MITTLSPQNTLDTVDSSKSVTLEWIQNLPAELKDEALYRMCRTIEAKPTLVESFALNQVFYRTISGSSFTESAESAAARTGCDRKTILKGLNQAVEQNILEENKRPGTSTEYSFKPVEEWLSEPVVHIKDTQKIGGDNLVRFPTGTKEDIVETEPALTTDDPETDANTVVNNLLKEEQQQLEVSVLVEDTPKKSPWKYVGQGLPRVYVPPELDQETGSKIESIHEATSRPRQGILKEAVDLLYNKLNRVTSFMEEAAQPAAFTLADAVINAIGTQSTIPDDVMQALKEAGIHLNLGVAERLWLKYSDKFEDAISYTIAQDEAGKIKQSKSGFFRKSLEEDWSFTQSPKQNQQSKQMPTCSLTPEQRAWYEWACEQGVCDGKPVADLSPTWNGELGVFVYAPAPNPMLPPWVLMPISQAMRSFPLSS